MQGLVRFGRAVGPFLLLAAITGCGFAIRVPFVGVGVRVGYRDVSATGDERIVTTYTHDGKTDRLELYQGRVLLNDVDYGSIEEGDQVLLTEEGLLVNGERRDPPEE